MRYKISHSTVMEFTCCAVAVQTKSFSHLWVRGHIRAYLVRKKQLWS